MTEFGKVAVMFGGNSAEREVSLMSGKAVLDGLLANGIDAHAFDPKQLSLNELTTKKFDRVFNVLHGRGGEDGALQGALDFLKIPYTGSGVLGAALSMDKIKTKQVWMSLGLPTAKFGIINDLDNIDYQTLLDDLGGVIMVKPANEGSSIGMAKVDNVVELKNAIDIAQGFDQDILLEQWIDGDEYTVAILGDAALPAIHMTTPNDFYDYQAKYQSNETQYHCPCGLPDEDELQLKSIALNAFKAVNAKGWGRVDFMRGKDEQWYLLEVNTVPGMTTSSLVPKAAKQAGIEFNQLVKNILIQTISNNE